MKSYIIIIYFAILVWNILPYFYRKHDNFYFFLFLGLNDFVGLMIWELFRISAQDVWILFFYLMLFGLNESYFKSKIKYFLAGIIPVTLISFMINPELQMIVTLIFSIFFFLYFTKQLISDYYLKDKLSVYYLILLFYWVITIFKLVAFLREVNLGMNVFYAGSVIQIIIGIVLILIEVFKKPKLATSS